MTKLPDPYVCRIKSFFWTWQEVIFWIPIAFFLVWGSYTLVPYIDPQAGLDGFGDIFIFFAKVFELIVIFFLVWMFKRTYWWDLPVREEPRLYKELTESYSFGTHALIIQDRLEWFALLCLFCYFLLG